MIAACSNLFLLFFPSFIFLVAMCNFLLSAILCVSEHASGRPVVCPTRKKPVAAVHCDNVHYKNCQHEVLYICGNKLETGGVGELGVATTNKQSRKVGMEWVCPSPPLTMTTTDTLTITEMTKNNLLEYDKA